MQMIAIALGGASGALLRFWASNGVYGLLGRGFPYGTLAVNLLGSLLMGFLYIMLVERMSMGPEVRGFLLVGLLGAFTTFSTFSFETLALIEQGELTKALLNMGLSLLFCLLACWGGILLGRNL